MFSSEVPADKKDKKTFQLNANCPLADSMGYIGNKFEHFPAWSLYSEVQVEHALTCLGAGPYTGGGALYRHLL